MTIPDKTVVVDLDLTLAGPAIDRDYANCPVITETAHALRRMHADGWRVVIFSARGMRTYGGDLEAIGANVLPVVNAWLTQHDIPHDEVRLGKPWPGPDGFYVDDRAIRPSEFASLTTDQITSLLEREAEWSSATRIPIPPGADV